MNKPLALVGTIAALSLAIAGCSSATTPSGTPTSAAPSETAAADPTSLVLAMEPSDDKADLEAQGTALATALSASIGIPVEVVVPDDYAALITALGTGQADIAFVAPASLVQAVDQGVAAPLFQVTREGSRSYVSQWFTNAPDTYCTTAIVEKDVTIDSAGATAKFKFCNGVDAATYGDIVGEDGLKKVTKDTKISFVDEGSASGYKFPVVQLQNLGIVSAPEELTGVTFAGGHPQSVLTVARGDAEIGTSYDDARAQALPEEPKVADLVVFAWSTPIPNDGVVVSSSLSAELQGKIKEAIPALLDDPAAKQALYDAYEVDGFAEPDLEALDVIRQINAQFK